MTSQTENRIGDVRPVGDGRTAGGQNLLAAGGVVAALGATSCCVIPFALFVAGVSGAWISNLTALERFQPIFVAAAVGCLGVGFYLVYRKPKGSASRIPTALNHRPAARPKSASGSPRRFSSSRWDSPASSPCSCNYGEKAMSRRLTAAATLCLLLSVGLAQAADKTIVLNIKNADCLLCPPIVKSSLSHVPGVKSVEIKQANQMAPFLATVTFDDAVTNVSALVAAPTNAGYPTQVVN
jgi:periplasmic mercuric ion binding protein